MANEDHIGLGGLMGGEPSAEVVSSNLDGLVSFISGIDLGMDNMSIGQGQLEVLMYMSWKRLKRSLVAHEAVDVDAEELPAAIILGIVLKVMGGIVVGGRERVGGGCSRVVSSGPLRVR